MYGKGSSLGWRESVMANSRMSIAWVGACPTAGDEAVQCSFALLSSWSCATSGNEGWYHGPSKESMYSDFFVFLLD